jgi:hypothetical protein
MLKGIRVFLLFFRDYKLNAICNGAITTFNRIILKEITYSYIDVIGRNAVLRFTEILSDH